MEKCILTHHKCQQIYKYIVREQILLSPILLLIIKKKSSDIKDINTRIFNNDLLTS
jgi:hypothetical protein